MALSCTYVIDPQTPARFSEALHVGGKAGLYIKGHQKIMTNDLESVFTNYSNDRLTDTGNEYQSRNFQK